MLMLCGRGINVKADSYTASFTCKIDDAVENGSLWLINNYRTNSLKYQIGAMGRIHSCNAGFRIPASYPKNKSKYPQATCQSDGTWKDNSGKKLVCEKIPAPPAPPAPPVFRADNKCGSKYPADMVKYPESDRGLWYDRLKTGKIPQASCAPGKKCSNEFNGICQ
jgi:hypothetical protein